jgi:hypothetical protein
MSVSAGEKKIELKTTATATTTTAGGAATRENQQEECDSVQQPIHH